MTNTPPLASSNNLLTTQRALLDTLTSFLTVCTHHIIFLRNLYPARSFLATRAYNYPVRQNRHPAVCAWINDAIAAIGSQLSKSTVDKVQLCIYETEHNCVLERWTFDLHTFAAISPRDQDVPFDQGESLNGPLHITDLEATFRATLSRITTTAARLKPLPSSSFSSPPPPPSSSPTTTTGISSPDCSFTLTIQLRERADRPVGRLDKHERAWIVAEPDSFSQPARSSSTSTEAATFRPTGRPQDDGATTPVRRLEAGELRMEVWVEESPAKFAYATPRHRTAEQRAKEMSYGEGTAGSSTRFDPEHGYEDVEGTDINRKPDTGRGAM